MALSLTDQGDLLTALHAQAGAHPFDTFLDRFRRRVGARHAMIVEHRPRGGWIVRRPDIGEALPAPPPAELTALRAGRVHPLDDTPGGGRAVRSGSASGQQWLVALDSAGGFDAADAVLMTNLAPHVAIACENLARLEATRMEADAADAALARTGVAWALLDRTGHPVAGRTTAGQRTRTALLDALAAGAPLAARDGTLAFPLPDGDALALARTPVTPVDRAAIFAAEHGCTRSEARLAIALAEGASLAGAADALGITRETARHYSKRLYAITGAKGQADLVRLVWTGLTALA